MPFQRQIITRLGNKASVHKRTIVLFIKYFSNKLSKIIAEVKVSERNSMRICTQGVEEESCYVFVFYFWTASYKIAFYYRRKQTRLEGSSACFASLINLVWSDYSFTNRSWREGNTASRVCRWGVVNLEGKGVVMVGVGGWPEQNPAGGHCTLLTRVTAVRVQPSIPEAWPDQHISLPIP